MLFLNGKKSTARLGINKGINILNPTSYMGVTSVPILSIYEVYFESALKLIPKGNMADTVP